jgi:hypothetical protein
MLWARWHLVLIEMDAILVRIEVAEPSVSVGTKNATLVCSTRTKLTVSLPLQK